MTSVVGGGQGTGEEAMYVHKHRQATGGGMTVVTLASIQSSNTFLFTSLQVFIHAFITYMILSDDLLCNNSTNRFFIKGDAQTIDKCRNGGSVSVGLMYCALCRNVKATVSIHSFHGRW